MTSSNSAVNATSAPPSSSVHSPAAAAAALNSSSSSASSPLSSSSSSAGAQKISSDWSYISRSLLAGGVAGCFAKTAVAPLDRVKILFQGSNSSVSQFSGSIFGGFRAVAWIGQQQGIRGVYKGHSVTLLRIFPYAALNYMCYEQYKQFLRKQQFFPLPPGTSSADLPPYIRLFAGSCAGLTSVFFTYPLDYVHSRITYQVKSAKYKGMVDTIRLTIEEAGVKGLYKGFGATALGIIPYAGMSFFTYDTLKHLAADYYKTHKTEDSNGEVPVPVKLMCGAVAGAAAQTASYPLDVVRRRMQLYGLSSQLPLYKNTFHALWKIATTEGIKKLYIGLSINYIKVPPSHAISFVTYEFMKEKLNIK